MRMMLLLLLAAACGCTAMRAVPPSDVKATIRELQPGDRIALRVARSDTWDENLRVVRITTESIETKDRNGRADQFPLQAVGDMRVERHAPGRTIALALGIYFGSLYALCGNPFTRHEHGC